LAEQVFLTNFTPSQLQEWVVSLGEPAYRAQQIRQWLYRSLESDIHNMANLPEELRAKLAERACVSSLRPLQHIRSVDGQTEKTLFALPDEQTIESVLMRYESRQTICVSTQVGCPIGCSFCATGQGGYQRNLTAGEIIDQVLHFARLLRPEGLPVTNVVYMGMGEPLLNYDAVWQSIVVLHDSQALSIGSRRFTISTAGVVPGIDRLSAETLQIGLAISLHAPDDELRDQLVPLNRRYPLSELLAACHRYVAQADRRITFEYALIDGVNDELAMAYKLIELLRGLPAHINLIPLNPTADSPYRASRRDRVVAFHRALRQQGMKVTLRLRRGVGISAGCGQLRSQAGDHQQGQRA